MGGQGRPLLSLPSWSSHRLSSALRRDVPSEPDPGPADLLGLELEFMARSLQGSRIHFGSLIHRLALDGSSLDPGDPNAYRCSWGGVITSDGAEAEIATPPVRTRPGFTAELHGWADRGQAALRDAVPPGVELSGYSAHFSAAMPASLNDGVCRLYAGTFAAPLMLLMNRDDSPGLLVRPRPGRAELCGEFTGSQALTAAAAFVAGSTRACAAAIRRRSARALLPPGLAVQPVPAVHRYGWYVDRRAFGADLHGAGRQTLLPRATGGTISAQSHLELAWAAARQALAEDAAAADTRAAEAMVTGALPLPAEHGQPEPPAVSQPSESWLTPGPRGSLRPPVPRLGACIRPGFTVHPVLATWDFIVFEACSPARRAYACVPRASLPGFASRLEDGSLDESIAAYLARPSRHRVLSAHHQTTRVGVYDQLPAPARLLAPERDPQTGRYEPGERGTKHALGRPGKRDKHEDPPKPRRRRRPGRIAIAVVTAAVLLIGLGVAASALSRGPGKPQDIVVFQPAALSFPATPVTVSSTRSLIVTNTGSTPVRFTRMHITGPARHDFSVPLQATLSRALTSSQAVQPAARLASCHRRIRAGRSCTLFVTFTPSAPGPRTADLRIHFAFRSQPRDIILTGRGIRRAHGISVTGLSPASGPAAGGTTVTIAGRGFTGVTGVIFGTTRTAPSVDSDTQLTATSPPGTGTVHVTLVTADGTAAPAGQFSYVAVPTVPTVTGVTPADGPAAGGTAVVITGSGFTGASSVSFGSTSTVPTVDSDTQISVSSPPGTGVVSVTVVAPGGTSAVTPASQFTYTAPPAAPTVTGINPARGPDTGGTAVTISGTGFTGATSVSFGSTSTVPTVDSDTQITATSPASTTDGPVDVTVTTPAGTSGPVQFTYFFQVPLAAVPGRRTEIHLEQRSGWPNVTGTHWLP
jgi:IPT/TIG domain